MINQQSDTAWLIVDWGTTNFRVFAMNDAGKVLDKKALPLGILNVADGDFSGALDNILSDWIDDYQHLPIYMAGMIGSQQGWKDAGYVSTPASISGLIDESLAFTAPWDAEAYICSGISHIDDLGNPDVMRGEEIQIFGLVNQLKCDDCTLVLPGTHSKHVDVVDGEVQSFKTYMTGELFSILSKNSILGKGLDSAPNNDGNKAFLEGVRQSEKTPLSHTLFLCRTYRLKNMLQANEVLDFLSGMLIGHEIRDLKSKNVYLVGDEKLCEKYKLACHEINIDAQFHNGDDCFLNGMCLVKELNS